MKVFKFLLALLLIICLTSPAAGASGKPNIHVNSRVRATPPAGFAPDHIVVKFKAGIAKSKREAVKKNFGAHFSRRPPSADFEVVGKSVGKTIAETVAEYKKDPAVEYAEPDYIMSASMIPNDPLYSFQWHLDNSVYGGIHAESAWDLSQGADVIVAVVDTGIAYEDYSPAPDENYVQAPDLADTSFAPGYDFVNGDTHPNDDESHGTHVAGTIAQSTNNGLGVAGVASKAILMPVKVLDGNGDGYVSDVAAGIRYAADNGAKVINMSLGGDGAQDLADAVDYAYGKGVVIVAAAGNDADSHPYHGGINYPAAYDHVIAVGATRFDETRSYYSNYGPELDIVAPGGDVTVDQNGDGYADGVLQNTFDETTSGDYSDFSYWFFQGTSMASPHVAGAAALIASQDPSMTPDDIELRLESTAEDKGAAGWDQYYGSGLLDIGAAVLPASTEILVSSLDLSTVSGGTNTWPGDDNKNKPALIDATVSWKLLVQAQSDFSGGGKTVPSTNLKMGIDYGSVSGISTTSTAEVAAGSAGRNHQPNLNTTLDVPWDETLGGKTLNTTLVYTVLPQ